MATNPTTLFPNPKKTALLVCDVQTNLFKVIFEFDKMVTNTTKLIKMFKLLNIPILFTEHNPKVLGPTVLEFDISGAQGPFTKMQLNMCTPEVREALSKICSGSHPETIILAGCEAHLCIEHTAIHFRNEGIEVHVVADCVSSRTKEDKCFALDRMKEMGCVITTTENMVSKIVPDTDNPKFKNIYKISKVPASHI